jgi:hypothetical protein
MEAVNVIFSPQGCQRARKKLELRIHIIPKNWLQYCHISSASVAMYVLQYISYFPVFSVRALLENWKCLVGLSTAIGKLLPKVNVQILSSLPRLVNTTQSLNNFQPRKLCTRPSTSHAPRFFLSSTYGSFPSQYQNIGYF